MNCRDILRKLDELENAFTVKKVTPKKRLDWNSLSEEEREICREAARLYWSKIRRIRRSEPVEFNDLSEKEKQVLVRAQEIFENHMTLEPEKREPIH